MNILSTLQKKLVILAILFAGIFAVNAQTPVAKYGQLKIFNGKVSDQNGNPVILRGMSMFWSGYPEGAPFYNSTTIGWLRDDWCVDVIRATMSVETGSSTYINNPSTEVAKIKAVIDACIAKGIYVIVDFHSHNAENYKSQAKTFFTDIATTYGNKPNILYETFNEPINQSWSGTIKPYHNELISTIRAIDPDNIIICGTKTYSQDVDEAANDPVTGTNVAYTLHYYANSHKASLRQKATNALNKGVALFVTEYGTCDASGNGGFNPTESQTWWDFLEANKLSSCNWAVDNKNETSAALNPGTGTSGWTAGQLSQSGTLVKAYIKGKCNSVLITGSLTIAFAGNKVSYNAGDAVTMTATATVSSGSVARVDYYDGTTLLSSQTSSPYTFTTSTLSSGGHNITAKSYTSAGALIAESPLYTISIVGASNVATTGITDQFESATQFSEMTGGTNDAACATNSTTGAAAGIYWFEDRDAATPFKAEATRTGNGTLQYLISQAANSYNVVGFNFGQYCAAGVKQNYTLDLTQNAILKLTVSAPSTNTATLDLKIQMKDADGTVIAINKLVLLPNGTVDGTNWYKYEIGFSKNHTAPDYLSLAPNSTTNFVFDFKNALSIKNPNNPTFPTDINTNNSDFDFSKVVEVVIVPVNKLDTGTPSYQPLAFTDQKIIFSGLSLGDPSLGTDICTTPKAVTTTDLAYCQGATDATALTAVGITGLTLKWYTDPTGGVANKVAPIPSTSVAGVTTYYVSQATSSPNTCEGPRTPLKVTITALPTADAGTAQTITTATTATLTGTGTAVGTWSVQTKPAAATVTFSPSATGATVTANGLTVDGTYTFKYTVAGCTPATATVDVVKSTPTCATPTTANAGTAQTITTATTASLTGTGTAVGTWTVQTKPTGATVTFNPSSGNAATVTASGLTVDGTYTFKYTVTGVSPCVDASSTVNVVKSTPVCANPTTANAGSPQSITTATSASLTGTGTTVGTWTVQTKPTGATVTFNPSSGNAASVTASGLTVNGTYTFKYTVTGVSPCVDASSTVDVVKSAAPCTNPTTANAGTGQTITTATTASLTGTGSAVGTWTVQTKPTGAAVTFNPSSGNAASVTASGLTIDGTYTFLYTVTGVSPCGNATSTVNVVKSTPVCTTPTTANAGTAQTITTATTASLTGTGTAVGTWTVQTKPTGAAVTFNPSSGNAASVTASGLTVDGTYTFKYTVTGTSPCVDASSTVNVVKSTPACTNPTTANAGTAQTITTATTASLTGTGTAVGTWTVQTKPTTATVTFNPSSGNAASVTASGLTVDGTYTFKYTVTGTSPCVDATSTVNVVKSSPGCANPTTANAGTNQSITTAITASLTGTGTTVGTWSLVNGPTTVTFNPSSGNAASVTASGLTDVGTYTFQYSVAGVSPCVTATSTMTVTKSTTTGINAAYLDANIELYPNPVADKLQVDMSKVDGTKSLQVVDMLGRVVYETENASIENIDMSDMSRGMYVIHINSDYGTYSKTVIKQ